jgi:uncharacterized protein (TIGR03437 family)
MKRDLMLPPDRATLAELRAGDEVLLSGPVFTARDATHVRLVEELRASGTLPHGLAGQVLFYAGPTQINALLPSSLTPQQDINMVVSRGSRNSDSIKVPGSTVGDVAPALPSFTLDGQAFRAAVQNSDGTVAGPDRPEFRMRPLRLGENGIIWANGLGTTTPQVPDGQPAPSDKLAVTDNTVEVYVNNVRQQVSFSGLAPGLSGLYQVNFTLDQSTPVKATDDNQVWLRVKGVESPHLLISVSTN